MELTMRKDVPKELTWDLTLLYPTNEAMSEDFARAKSLAEQLQHTWKGRLTTPQAIASCLEEYQEIECILNLCSNYTELQTSVDCYDTKSQDLDMRIRGGIAEIESMLSFLFPEIVANSEDVLTEAITLSRGCRNYLKEILRQKPHMLSAESEKVLAALRPVFGTPYDIYNISKLADMQFDSFTVNGREYPLGYSLFEDNYEYERDTDVRRAAFAAFSEKLRQYENTTAAAYNAQVTQEKIESQLRGFDNVFDCLLFPQHVTREMYDRQIDLITRYLAPYMQKYARLLQHLYRLDEMTAADLKMTVDPDYVPSITIADAKKYCMDGLSILGEDYVSMVEEAFDHRWIDFARNQGKSTGGFCACPYGKNSYILLSWNGRMSDVMTVAHELGHAGHFKSCNGAQSLFDTDVSTYMVESPSTMNELLMAHYLLKTNDDPRFRRWVLSSMISNTYYHNFVTHLLEADYQRKVYRIIDEGGSVNAEVLNGLFHETLTNFWGDAVTIDDNADRTWMRQPHYYMGLYSYTYSAGLTVATEVCKRIESEGQTAVEDWKKVLAAGSTLDPVGLAGLAGIDITTDAPLMDTISYIGSIIDEICRLTEIIGD